MEIIRSRAPPPSPEGRLEAAHQEGDASRAIKEVEGKLQSDREDIQSRAAPEVDGRLQSERQDVQSRGVRYDRRRRSKDARKKDATRGTTTVVAAINGAQPGYCVKKDCAYCLQMEAMIGVGSLCKSSCPACVYCIMTKSCIDGLALGALSCGIDCGFGTLALGGFYATKAKCPSGYLWMREHCPKPFYEESGSSSSSEERTTVVVRH